jgi:CheY-like chemotaxis protein
MAMPADSAGSADSGTFVMVVDDDPGIRESIETLLPMFGHAVVGAADGAEALARLRAGDRPCLILLDLMMPGLNGFDLRTHLMADATLAEIPIIVITGAGQTVAARASAMDLEVMRKPFELSTLLAAVRRFCTRRPVARPEGNPRTS